MVPLWFEDLSFGM